MGKRTLLLLFPFLVGCGGPQFSVSYKYEPPVNRESCLSRCRSSYELCRQRCEREKETCLSKVRKEAEELYKRELSSYNKELSAYQKSYLAYQRDLLNWNRNFKELYRDYIYFKTKCKRTKDHYACQRKEDLEEALETLNEMKPKPPVRPKKPEFSQIFRELSASCPLDCSCKEVYDVCFTSCGGRIVPQRICVKNCN